MRPLDGMAKQAHFKFKEHIDSLKITQHYWHDKSTVLLIDNWRTLHGRAGVASTEHRELERLCVEVA